MPSTPWRRLKNSNLIRGLADGRTAIIYQDGPHYRFLVTNFPDGSQPLRGPLAPCEFDVRYDNERCCREGLYRWLHAQGYHERRVYAKGGDHAQHKLSDEQRQRLVAWAPQVEEGKRYRPRGKVKELCQHFGVTRQTVYRVLKAKEAT